MPASSPSGDHKPAFAGDITTAEISSAAGKLDVSSLRIAAVPSSNPAIIDLLKNSTHLSAESSIFTNAHRPTFAVPTSAIDAAMLESSSSIKKLLQDSQAATALTRTELNLSTPDILNEPTFLAAAKSVLESSAVIRAPDSISAFSLLARSPLDATNQMSIAPNATDIFRQLASGPLIRADYLTATDSLTALTSSLAATSSLRHSLLAGIGASEFLAAHVKASDAFSSSLAHLNASANFSTALSGVRLADTALKELSVLAATGRRYFGEPALSGELVSRPELFAVAKHLTTPYLSAAAAVVSLESRLTSLPLGLTTVGLISATDLSSLRTSLSVLSGAATEAWKTYGGSIALPNPSDSVLAWLRKPATELYTAAQVVASVSLDPVAEAEVDEEIESEIDEQDGVFEARLRRLDPDLVGVFRGGVQALERGGADWQRHTLVSFREVATHVLHKLSPDEDVKKIAAEADIVRGKPTRAVRMRFIFSEVADGIVTNFFAADTKAALELFDLLNNGTHRLGEVATTKQARFIKSRLVGLVAAMLEARGY